MSGASAFLRFSRDRRGYEHFYLIEPTTNRQGRTRAQVLYWFRTPPGVRVGRLPFDDEMQRAIQERHPGVSFDWKRILATPIPPPAPDVERWRDRRRAERTEKAARKAELTAGGAMDAGADSQDESAADAARTLIPEPPGLEPDLDADSDAAHLVDIPVDTFETARPAPPEMAAASGDPLAQPSGRRRRRRRGGRGRRVSGSGTAGVTAPGAGDPVGPAARTADSHSADEPAPE